MRPLILLLWPALALAQVADPTVTAELSLREAFLGDPVALTVRLKYGQEWTFDRFLLPEKLGEARVLSQEWREPKPEAGDTLKSLELHVALAWYRLGPAKVPPIELSGHVGDAPSQTVATPELNIEIVNMLKEGDEDLAPGKDQVALEAFPLWPVIAGALVLLALIGWLIYRRLAGRGSSQPAPVKPLLSPYREAIDSLNGLTSGDFLKQGKFKEFYVEINLIIRHFYARMWGIHAEEMTSFEMEEWLAGRQDLPDGLVDMNRTFQDRCDLVKFAKHDPVVTENQELVNWAYQIVERFKPKGDAHVAAG